MNDLTNGQLVMIAAASGLFAGAVVGLVAVYLLTRDFDGGDVEDFPAAPEAPETPGNGSLLKPEMVP